VAERSAGWLRVIAVFKIAKALLCLAVAFGALKMLEPGIAERARHTINALATHVDRRWAEQIIAWMSRQPVDRFHVIAIGAFFYAALFTTEGLGLWEARRWAEYLTVIATISFIPFELYELIHRQTVPRIAALVINVAVVVYLIQRLRHSDERPEAAHS
jgi:uncharacterized membrane protein (DUF2068 family)